MRQTWIVVCVIVLLPLIGCGQMAAKTEATENPLVTYSTPSYKPAFSGVDHTIRELARRAASLVDEHEDHLLGSYVDKADESSWLPEARKARGSPRSPSEGSRT